MLDRLTDEILMQALHEPSDRLIRRQQATIRHEAAEGHVERDAAETRIGRRLGYDPPDVMFDIPARVSEHDADPHADTGARRHRAVPLAALNGAEVDVDGVRLRREGRVDHCRLVHPRLVAAEVLDHHVCRIDRVDAAAHLPHVHRPSRDGHPRPDDTDFRNPQRLAARTGFRNDDALRHRQGLHHGERAVACAFLLDHRGELNLGGRLHAGELERSHRRQDRCVTGLHVAGAAPVEAAVADRGFVGRRRPEVRRSLMHDVQMALQQEALPQTFPRAMHGHHVTAPGIRDDRRREARVTAKRRLINADEARGEPKGLIHPRHLLDAGSFLAEHAAVTHKA